MSLKTRSIHGQETTHKNPQNILNIILLRVITSLITGVTGMSRNKTIKLRSWEVRAIARAENIFEYERDTDNSAHEFVTNIELTINKHNIKKVIINTLEERRFNGEAIGSFKRCYETTNDLFYDKDELDLVSSYTVDYSALDKYKNMFNHLSQ